MSNPSVHARPSAIALYCKIIVVRNYVSENRVSGNCVIRGSLCRYVSFEQPYSPHASECKCTFLQCNCGKNSANTAPREFLLGANFRMFYLSKCSFVNVIASTMTHPKLLGGRIGLTL